MLKKVLLVVVAVVALLVVVGLLLPRTVHVERSARIATPPATVFPLVNSMARFNEWSPWKDLDPHARMTLSGPAEGVGASLHWEGNSQIGVGSDAIIESVPDQHVGLLLEFGGGRSTASINLASEEPGTLVTWTLDMDLGANPFFRYMGLFMDRLIGPDFERGLSRLKALAEATPRP
jgi:hypothetical protein